MAFSFELGLVISVGPYGAISAGPEHRYPEFDTTGHWHKVVPSQGLSDLLLETINPKDHN